MANILVRADASSTIGTGHILRCLVLAEALRENGEEVLFITRPHTGNLDRKIRDSGFSVMSLVSSDTNEEINEVSGLIQAEGASMIVFDHYGIDYRYEKRVKDATAVRVMALDDMYEAHHCDIVLNQNIYADAKRYDTLVPKQCKRLCGPEYALIRKEFRTISKRDRSIVDPKQINLLVTLGGADPDNVTLKVLQVLEQIDHFALKTTVVIGTANPHLSSIKAFASSASRAFNVIVNATNMAELMNDADAAISAAGSTTLELMYMNVPTLLVVLANNQELAAHAMQEFGYGIRAGFAESLEQNALKAKIVDFLNDVMGRKAFGNNPPSLSLGHVQKLVKIIICDLYSTYRLREAALEDMIGLFELSNDPEVRAQSLHSMRISLEEHIQWFGQRLENKPSPFLIVDFKGKCLGQVRFDKKKECYVVSISLSKKLRGCGFASDIILKSLQLLPERSCVNAYIKRVNAASIKSFERSGFSIVGEQKSDPDILLLTRFS